MNVILQNITQELEKVIDRHFILIQEDIAFFLFHITYSMGLSSFLCKFKKFFGEGNLPVFIPELFRKLIH